MPNPASPTDGRDSVSKQTLTGILAFGVALIALCYGLGRTPLLPPDEGRNAEIAREMKESGRWLVPAYNGADYLDKPAFYFKAVALSFSLLGESEAAARSVSTFFGLALLVVTYWFCSRASNRRCAALAVMVIATTPLYIAYSRIVIFDIPLTFFTCTAIMAGYIAEEQEGRSRRNWYLLGAALAGLATLVKGPVGFIVPALVLCVFYWIEGRRGAIKRLLSPLNLCVFFAVVLPWFVGVSLVHPDFPRYGIIEESFHRFTTNSFRRTKPVYFYPLIIAGTFFPWSLLLPESILLAWRQRVRWTRLDRLCVVWSITVVIFFSLSKSKMPGYILSAAVASGILVARLFDRAIESPTGGGRRIANRAAAALVVVGVCIAAVMLYAGLHPVAAGRVIHLTADQSEQLMRYAPQTLSLFLFLAALAAFARYRQSVHLTFATFVLSSITLIVFDTGAFEFFSNRRSVRDLAFRVSALSASAEVACLECLPHGLPYYLKRTVTLITADGSELTSNYVLFDLKSNPQWPPSLVRLTERDRWLDSRRRPIYLIAKSGARLTLERIAAERGGRVFQLTPDFCGLLLPAPRNA